MLTGKYIDMHTHVLPGVDDGAKDITESIEMLKDAKEQEVQIVIHDFPLISAGIEVTGFEVQEDGQVKSTLANGTELYSDEVLVAIGRTLNTRGMGLEEVGIEMRPNGQIVTDKQMRTSVPNIFAAGDITEGTQLSDKAQRQGLLIAETIAGNDYWINYDAIPGTLFMEPEIAMVGLTVNDAQARGIEVISGSLPFSSNEKAIALGKTEGIMKVVARKDDHVIIGAQIFGPEACDLIAEYTVAVENGQFVMPTFPVTVSASFKVDPNFDPTKGHNIYVDAAKGMDTNEGSASAPVASIAQAFTLFDGQVLATTTPRQFFAQNSFYTTAAARMCPQA